MKPLAFFITGTDTEIGKTTIATALLFQAQQHGLSTLASKPIASGCELTALGLRNQDALLLQQQCSIRIPYPILNPYAFEPPIAPHIAAAQVQQRLNVQELQQAIEPVLQKQADLTLIEGAGGWHVPLNDEQRLSDLALTLNLPIIVVVGIRLGCINHALLTIESIQNSGLPIAGWVANQCQPATPAHLDNVAYLHQQIARPMLGVVPYLAQPTPALVSSYLDLTPILQA